MTRRLRLRRTRRAAEPAVCDDLVAWASSYPGARVEHLAPAREVVRPLPRTVGAPIDPSFAAMQHATVPPRALVTIPNARLRVAPVPPPRHVALPILPTGEHVGELVAVTPQGRREMLRDEAAARTRLPRRVHTIAGDFVLLHGFGVRNHYHWNHDIVMSLGAAASRLPPTTTVVVPDPLTPLQVETLALLGLADHARVPIPGDAYWEVERLHVVVPKLKTPIDHAEPFAWFRTVAFDRYGTPLPGRRRLFLARREARHWRIANLDEVEHLLVDHGFESIDPGSLDLAGQVAAFAGAEAVVGTGAGLFDTVFCPPRTSVLQLQERGRLMHSYWTAAAALGLDYHYLVCDAVANPGGVASDLHVPLDDLRASLVAMGIH